MTSWATVDDVLDVTGLTVSEDTVRLANYAIEAHTGRLAGATAGDPGPKLRTRDVEWLRRAVAYQAAWLTSQPDYLGRMDVTQVGSQAATTQLTDTAMTLGPMAAQCLRRCSWERTGTLSVRSDLSRRGADEDGPDAWGNQWEAM